MSDIKWTTEQLDAIGARDAKVLVNAAAGSGKTAVLTTRIINRLVPENGDEPVRADRLLVVTFTKAAASEMRERIEKGLKEVLKTAAHNGDMKKRRFVQNQIKQLQGAKICTIDSFCQSFVKEYFHILNIDPNFRIAQKSEERQLRDEVFDNLMERLYEKKDASFMLLASRCTKSGREDMLRDMVERIYNFTSNMPYPIAFIETAAKDYLTEEGFFKTAWSRKLKEEQVERLKLVLESLDDALFGLQKEKLEKIIQMPYEQSLPELRNFAFDAPDDIDENTKSEFVKISNDMKELCDHMPSDIKQTEEFLKEVFYPEIKALADVTVSFIREIEAQKHSKSVFAFSDIEIMAYRLLFENDAVRREQIARFDEILIDEYQDTNELQDGIFQMLTNGKNLFMVGDMKQSIYRFRGSEPLVFRSKADSYSYDEKARERKITLTKNYRSRNEVLLSINDLFEKSMSRVVGELNYDVGERLNLGNDGFVDTGCSYKSEFALLEIDAEDDDALDKADVEAEYIAKKILEMKKNGFLVRDRDETRPLKNSDIVILMSSHKTEGENYTEVLGKYGIACVCNNEGYFEQAEIKLAMALLAAIDNPERDIPMAAVMRSFIGGFSDDEIARIRLNGKNVSLYRSLQDICAKFDALKEKNKLTAAGEIFGEKAVMFVGKINSWRDKSRYMSCQRLVNMLFEEAGFYAFFSGEDMGERTANLQLFFDKAKDFERSGYRGIFTFLRYIERLAKNGDDLESKRTNTDGDYVRMMTIHKSKGLEFPVVFLAGCEKRFNRKDAEGKMLLHQKLGISLDYTDYNDGVLILNPLRGIFENTIKGELLSEEMRKLYVALTRAKEKVIVTAGIKKTSKLPERLADWQSMSAFEMKNEAKNAKTFTDWLAPVAMNSENWEFDFVQGLECGEAVLAEKTPTKPELPDIEKMKEILSYSYPFAAKNLKSKAAVSDFKGISHQRLSEKPRFLQDKKVSGADFGTAVHKIMETLPRNRGEDREYISEHISLLSQSGDITEKLAESIAPEKIVKFFQSPLGKRFQKAKEVHSESEFEITLDAKELLGEYENEQILLQGIIDCWFEEEDGIVLVDYKTDRVENLEEIHQKYDVQLDLYARALEKIAKKRVKEKFIYLFSKDCVVQC